MKGYEKRMKSYCYAMAVFCLGLMLLAPITAKNYTKHHKIEKKIELKTPMEISPPMAFELEEG